MKTYVVTTYGNGSYTVDLDENGVVKVDGLLYANADGLRLSVRRHMEKRGLSPIMALRMSVGPYSSISEAENSSVSGDTEPSEIS